MNFDESTTIKGIGRKVSGVVDKLLSKAKDLTEIIDQWVTTSEREVTLCNGVDDQNHFESLAIILKDGGKHIAERYISLQTIHQQNWSIKTASSFVNWNQYSKASADGKFSMIEDYFDIAGYKRSLTVSEDSIDPYLALPVLTPKIGTRAALAHALSPYSEATFSLVEEEFFEGDEDIVKSWGKNKIMWLFTTLRSPHPVQNMHPELLESLIVDFSARTTPKKIPTRSRRAQLLH